MDKYLVTEIPDNQLVVIDVPEDGMDITSYIDDDSGNAHVVFTKESAGITIPLLRVNISYPEQAQGIAAAFARLADAIDAQPEDEPQPCCRECMHSDPIYYKFCYEIPPDKTME